MKHVGKQYRFIYPNYGTPDGYPDYTAHSGQIVTVVGLVSDGSGLYIARAADGWEGHINDDELNPLHPRKGNIVRVNHPEHINDLFRVESVGRKFVALTRFGDKAYIPNFPRDIF